MLYYRNVVHHAGRFTVDVFSVPECLQHPVFTGEPGKHPRLDGGKIAHHEAPALRGDERGPDQFRQHERCLTEKQLHGLEVVLRGKLPREVEIRQGVPCQIVRLNDAPCPPARPVGTIELQDPAQPSVGTDRVLHGMILCHGCLSERLADLQGPPDVFRQVPCEEFGDVVFPQRLRADAPALQPGFQLGKTVRIAESGDLPGLRLQFFPVLLIMGDDHVHHRNIQTHAAIIHPLVQLPQVLFAFGKLIPVQLLAYCHLSDDVLPVVLDIELPLLPVVSRKVPGPPVVALRRPARFREVLYEAFADRVLQLVLREAECDTGARQGSRQPAFQGHDHGITPLLRRHLFSQRSGKARSFERRIPSTLLNFRIRKRLQEIFGPRARLSAVMHLYRAAIEGITDDQDLEIRGAGVSVYTAAGEISGAIRFQIHR